MNVHPFVNPFGYPGLNIGYCLIKMKMNWHPAIGHPGEKMDDLDPGGKQARWSGSIHETEDIQQCGVQSDFVFLFC